MFVDDLFDKKTLTEAQGGGSPWHSEPEQQQMDADRRGRLGRERNAGLDEPDDAASGPVQTGNGVYEYTVPAGQEGLAQELGLQQHQGHWVSRVPIQRANFQFGQPQFHEIPAPGVAEGVRDLGYDAQSLIMKLRRDVEEKRLQPTPQAVLAAARELAGDMEFAPQLLVKQVLGQGVAEGKKNDDNEPFNYDEWKASTVKPRKPRGHKDAEALGKAIDSEQSELRKRKEQGVAEGGYPEVDHMPGPTIKRTQTGCKRCHGKGYVYKTPDGEVHPMNRPDAKKYKCGKCNGIGFVKVGEGMMDNPSEEDSPVAQAIIRRILLQRTDLLGKYGPEKVGAAVDEVADFVGDVDEIGSSDVSGWVRHVEQMLGNMGEGLAEGQLDELSFKDIQKSANKFAKGANKFTKNVADTGAAVGNAAGALGGAIKQVGKTAIADPVAATYNATKSGLGKASNVAANTYGDLKKGVQTVGKAGQAVGSDIGAAGTAVGKGLQSVGRGVANVAGGTTGALGSVVGGATTGLGRAAASGFNAGVQNVGGNAIDKMQTNIMTPKAADIQKQIAIKKDEIKALQATLAGEQSAATTGGKSGIQTGATALIDPDTNRPYEKDKLASLYGYKEPEAAAAAKTPAAPAAQPQGFSAANVMNLPGMARTPAKPAAPAKTVNFAGPGGYGATTTGFKSPSAPSSPALAAPKLPAAPRVTAGGPTPAEKANLDKRIAAAAPAVAEALAQVERMLESVNSKKSAEMVKAYVDQRFTELGLRNTTECRNIMARVVQESAVRRRAYAQRMAK